MAQPDFTVEFLKPGDLTPHPLNFRRHPDLQKTALRSSIEEHGYLSAPIVNKRSGHVLDGHARIELAVEQREETIPVRVIDVPEEQERRILRVFDAVGALAEEDNEALDRLIAEINDADLERLLGDLEEGGGSGLRPEADPDEVPEDVETRCQAGDLWALEDHRLLCGDATIKADIARLMGRDTVALCLADPPYNAGLDYGDTTDDEKTAEEYARFSRSWWGLVSAPIAVMTPGWTKFAWWVGEFPPRAYGAWTKANSMVHGSISRFNTWEPILFWGGDPARRTQDVFDYALATNLKGTGSHPCPKPVSLWSELISCYSHAGQIVYDPFVGSGTTLIACEQTGRVARCCEISPAYVSICVARWEQATGREAKLLARSA